MRYFNAKSQLKEKLDILEMFYKLGVVGDGRKDTPSTEPQMQMSQLVTPIRAGDTSGNHVDIILRTGTRRIQPNTKRMYGAEQSKAIRDLFRQLGWARYFRVTKGCWSLGPSIEWANGFQPKWFCDRVMTLRAERGQSPRWFEIPVCGCATCRHRDAQREAIRRRVHYALNEAFKSGREFGDRSDSMTDYFDSDYTFHP